MTDQLAKYVIEATLRVFETSTFMNVFPFEEETPRIGNPFSDVPQMIQPAIQDLEQPNIAAMMYFKGPRTGKLTLTVSRKVMTELAMNMLGELDEGESPDEKGRDAVKEILNMICGNLLTLWEGEDPVFNLSPPEIIEPIPETGLLPELSGVHVPFNIEDTLAEVIVEQG